MSIYRKCLVLHNGFLEAVAKCVKAITDLNSHTKENHSAVFQEEGKKRIQLSTGLLLLFLMESQRYRGETEKKISLLIHSQEPGTFFQVSHTDAGS